MSVSPIAPVNAGSPPQAVAASGDAAPTTTNATPVEGASAQGSALSQSSSPLSPNPIALAVNIARAEAAVRQGSLAPLLADLSQAISSSVLPKEVKAAIAQVLALQTPTDEPVTTETIKVAVAQSGLFLEAHLAGPAPSAAAPPDLKAALLVLQRALAAVPASSPSVQPEPAPPLTPARPSVPAPPGAPIAQNSPSAPSAPIGSPTPAGSAIAATPAGAATLSLPPTGAAIAQAQPVPPPSGAASASPISSDAVTTAAAVVEPELAPAVSFPETLIPRAQAPQARPGTANLAGSLTQPLSTLSSHQGAPDARSPSASSAAPDSSPALATLSTSATSVASTVQAEVAVPETSAITSPITMAQEKGPIVQATALPASPNGGVEAAMVEATLLETVPSLEAELPPLAPPFKEPRPDINAALLVLKRAAAAVPTGRPMAPSRTAAPPPPLRQSATIAQAAGPGALPAGDEVTVAQHLAGGTDQALARLTLHQLASLPNLAGGPAWIFELPLATPQGAAMAQFVIDRDDEAAAGEPGSAQAWRTRFSIDVESLGPVHVHLRMGQDSSAVTIWAERMGAVDRLRSQGPALAQALSADVAIHPGAPRRAAPLPGPGQFIDQSS